MPVESAVYLPVGGAVNLPAPGTKAIIFDSDGTAKSVDSTGLRSSLSGDVDSWRGRMAKFMRSQFNLLDGPEAFSDFSDVPATVTGGGAAVDAAIVAASQDWVGSGNPTGPSFGVGGVLTLGAFNETVSIRPKFGSTGGLTENARANIWGVAARGSPTTAGATNFYGMVGTLMGANRFGFGYCGSLSTSFYSAWVESGSSVFANSVVTTVPVSLHQSPDQDFVVIFDGAAVFLYYGAASGTPGVNPTLVGRMTAINNFPVNALAHPACWARTLGAGAASNHACILGLTGSPR